MLSDKELDQAAAQLASFRIKDDEYHRNHAEILDKYGALIDDFKRLKSDFEEARDSRERYKQMAKGGERNPFVLVLVDGDGYVFDDDLLESKAEGGSRAAQLLNDAVQRTFRDRPELQNCSVMVRIYANLAGLSKAVAKAGLVGFEKRALGPFVANFNRSNVLFDFVDAGELKENADSKIRGLFRHFIENTQCRHIYFAACHDVGYINELTSYASQRDRITLVRNYAFHKEFARLGLRVVDFPGIFRSSAIPYAQNGPTEAAAATAAGTPSKSVPSGTANAPLPTDSSQVCSFYQKGLCKYGKGCKFTHVKLSSNGSALPNPADTSDNWRSPSKVTLSQLLNRGKSEDDLMESPSKSVDLTLSSDFTVLPPEDSIPPNKIPVNKHDERVDPYLPPITSYDRALFKAQVAKQKLCNSQQLLGYCSAGAACQYDHTPINENMKRCLKETTHSQPCPRRNACRSVSCTHGHVCQKPDCRYRGGSMFCKFPFPMHGVDMICAKFVPGINTIPDENGSIYNDGANGGETESPPPPPSYSSDEEVEKDEAHGGAKVTAIPSQFVGSVDDDDDGQRQFRGHAAPDHPDLD